MMITPEKIDDLSKEKLKAIMERSMEDISSVYDYIREIVEDVRDNGDEVSLKHYTKHKSDIARADLEATKEEIAEKNPDVYSMDNTTGRKRFKNPPLSPNPHGSPIPSI